MPTTLLSGTAPAGTYNRLILPALIAAGLVGNYFKLPLFLNIDFLFGSIFAMLALQFFGPARGILAAVVISSYTYILWNHPYAVIIMSAEMAVVAWLMTGRRKMGMVLADTLFWLFVGIPLIYLFYHLVMHAPYASTSITMTKQAVNGIANALIARLIFTGYVLRSRSSMMSYREIVYNLLAFFVLCPALAMLAISGRADFNSEDHEIREDLVQDSRRVNQRLTAWLEDSKKHITLLAEMAATKSPQQMQSFLEQAHKSETSFLRVGLMDKGGTGVAFSPLVDELGQNILGKNFANRPYIPTLQKTLKPMLSEVGISWVGTPKPRVAMLAPVVIGEKYGGYVIGVLNLDEIREHLDKISEHNSLFYTLADFNGNVIMSNRADQKVLNPFSRGTGTTESLEKSIFRWSPSLPPNTPISERWKKSMYISETSLGQLSEWRLILEQPVAPIQKKLFGAYTGRLFLLFLILLAALVLAEFLSRRFILTFEKLRDITSNLPTKLAEESREISWPDSGVLEAHHLVENFKITAESLAERFNESRQTTKELEQRVEERTEKLDKANSELMNEIAERKQIENHLLENEFHLRAIIDNEPECIKIVDAEGSLIQMNPAGLKMIEAETFAQVAGCPVLDVIAPEYRDAFLKMHQRVIAGEADQMEFEVLGLKGGRRWLQTHAVPMKSYGAVVHLAVTRDISEQKRAQQQLLESNHMLMAARDQAEAANSAKSQFLANMSHEIRTPLNGVLGMTQLLEFTGLTEEQQEYVDALKLSGHNLLKLINDILDLSKIEAGKVRIEVTEFSLQQVISEVVMMQKFVSQEKGLLLTMDVSPELPTILVGDQLRIKQIFHNLVGNAVKFTNSGAIAVTAELLERHGRTIQARISVRDTGIGISPTALEAIFKPFTQEDGSTTRKYGGTGLGLTISRRLAELMDGTISIESTQGAGSCFTVTLPLGLVENTDSLQETSESDLPGAWKGPSLKILLVDDDQINIKFGLTLLQKLGHDVITVENGRDCLAVLEEVVCDLVLMDINMPVMNGEDALAEIRRKESGTARHQLVIALTAHSMGGEAEQFLANGFDGYLSKPLAVKDLIREIMRVTSHGKTASTK